MKEPKHLPYGHLLHFLSPQNKQMVANYLTLLQARQYDPRQTFAQNSRLSARTRDGVLLSAP